MREIKFRFWHVDSAVMLYDLPQLSFVDLNASLVELTESSYIMQFTGVIDANTKDIYEGDIIKVLETSGFKNCIVKWCDDLCGFYLSNSNDKYELNRKYCDYYFIIGNIHEDKDLIK